MGISRMKAILDPSGDSTGVLSVSPEDVTAERRPRPADDTKLQEEELALGWVLILLWTLGALGLAVVGFVQGSAAWYEKAFVGALVGGGLLLFLSVLLDRLQALKSDRYGRVKK